MSSCQDVSYQCGECQRIFSSQKALKKHYKEHSCHSKESHHKSSARNTVIILGTNMQSLIGKEQRVPSMDDSVSDGYQMHSISGIYTTVSSPSIQPSEAQNLVSFQRRDRYQRSDASEDSSSLASDNIHPRKKHRGDRPYLTSVDNKKTQMDNFLQKRSSATSQKPPERKEITESSQRNSIHRKDVFPNESMVDVENNEDLEIVYESTDNFFCPQCQQRFADKLALHRHFAWHLNNDSNQTIENLWCPQCHQKFADKLALRRHFAWHLNNDCDQTTEDLSCPQCQQKFADKLTLHRHFAWHLNNDCETEHRPEVSHEDTNTQSPEKHTEIENETSDDSECLTIKKLLDSPGLAQKVYVKWILEGNEEEYRTALMMEKFIVHQWMNAAV